MTRANRTVRLKVDGWSNIRFGHVEGNFIVFEVMWLGCACPTCFARLDAVKNRMRGSEVKWQVLDIMIPERVVMPSVTLMVEPKEMPERVDSYLSDLLGLQISEVA
ncbi:MAG: hypothetical protein UV98_C0014G0003 [Parcubacteria group bacterium GW2011_GWB1_43_6]|nr:MAG: hypothetical protein UV98_C0014G0003 [Parcubacteria group bacterium GW2011_GWB1_43_6]